MRPSSFDFSFGLTTINGHWPGIRFRWTAQPSIVDRNLEMALVDGDAEGGPLPSLEGSSEPIASLRNLRQDQNGI
jgi:hypothetical protein